MLVSDVCRKSRDFRCSYFFKFGTFTLDFTVIFRSGRAFDSLVTRVKSELLRKSGTPFILNSDFLLKFNSCKVDSVSFGSFSIRHWFELAKSVSNETLYRAIETELDYFYRLTWFNFIAILWVKLCDTLIVGENVLSA